MTMAQLALERILERGFLTAALREDARGVKMDTGMLQQVRSGDFDCVAHFLCTSQKQPFWSGMRRYYTYHQLPTPPEMIQRVLLEGPDSIAEHLCSHASREHCGELLYQTAHREVLHNLVL